MHFFFDPTISTASAEHTLSAEESLHAVKVLRLGAGATLHIVDGRGNLHEARMVVPDPRGCVVRVVAVIRDYGHRRHLTMAVAPTKNSDRLEWFIEKATEVGLDALVPIECANSERRVFKPERAVRVAVSAMKQSLKASLPEIAPLTPFRELVARPFEGVKLIAHCREDVGAARVAITELLKAGEATLVLIGPEGDFTAEEVEMALAAGFRPISLGDSRLRTETAALVATAAVYLANLR